MNNCVFLHIGGGICPYHTRNCDKSCDKYSIVGDDSKPIFHDWNNGIEKLAAELRQKYFGITEKSEDTSNIQAKTKENEDIEDVNDFLGGFD